MLHAGTHCLLRPAPAPSPTHLAIHLLHGQRGVRWVRKGHKAKTLGLLRGLVPDDLAGTDGGEEEAQPAQWWGWPKPQVSINTLHLCLHNQLTSPHCLQTHKPALPSAPLHPPPTHPHPHTSGRLPTWTCSTGPKWAKVQPSAYSSTAPGRLPTYTVVTPSPGLTVWGGGRQGAGHGRQHGTKRHSRAAQGRRKQGAQHKWGPSPSMPLPQRCPTW